MNTARPTTPSSGMVPWNSSSRWNRESADRSRWSPRTKSAPRARGRRSRSRGRVARVEVRLVHGYAVDGDAPAVVAALHGVAADRDDTLDEVLLVVGRQQPDERHGLLDLLDDDRVRVRRDVFPLQPAPGVAEDDDVPALRPRAEPGGQLVHEHPVVDPIVCSMEPDGMTKACTRNVLRTSADEDGDGDQDGDLLDRGAPAPPLDPAGEPAPLGAPRKRPAAVGRPRTGGQPGVGAVPSAPLPTHGRRPLPSRAAARVRRRRHRCARPPTICRPASRSSRPCRSPAPRAPCRRRGAEVLAGVP